MEAKRANLPLSQTTRPPAVASALTVISSTWTLGALVFVVTWGGGFAEALTPSIDHSLHAGLQMAAAQGLDYGPELVFTYGPLGFLKSYLAFVPGPTRLAAVYGLALHLALSISLVWAIRRNFGPVIAVALAIVAAAFARGDLPAAAVRDDAAVVVLTLIWCVTAISNGSPDWARRIVIFAGPPFAALELLAKLNTGLVVAALVAITVIAISEDRRRNLIVAATGFAGSLAVLWLATRQGLEGIASFVSGTLEIMTGYSSGARLDWEDRGYDYLLAPLVMIAAVAIAWISSRGLPWRPRAAILVMVAIVLFTAAKGGFVSHEAFHMATFYGTVLGACLAFPLPPRPRIRYGALAATVAVIGAAFTASFGGYPMLNPLENASNGAATVASLVDSSRLDAEIAENRSRLTAGYRIDPRTLELVEGRPVHVDPSEAAAAWAYGLDWHPLPVFQPYAAWTPDLDRRNADAVASPEGPEVILRQRLNALGRYPAYESPAAMIAMLCNFEAARTTSEWQVLERVPNRCGEPRPLGTETGTYGTPFALPDAPPGNIVYARVHGVDVSGLERVRTALLRSKGRQVSFDGEPRPFYTLIAATAADGLLLRAAPGTDFPAPFGLAPDGDTVTFLLNGGAADHPIELELFSMPVRR
jgi:hypothetical protein